jgi:hypothetical protein
MKHGLYFLQQLNVQFNCLTHIVRFCIIILAEIRKFVVLVCASPDEMLLKYLYLYFLLFVDLFIDKNLCILQMPYFVMVKIANALKDTKNEVAPVFQSTTA